jgi:putative effector of murein hydrolase
MASELFAQPIFSVSVTVGFYAAALQLNKRWPFLHPLVATTVALLIVVGVAEIPPEAYR